MKINPDQFTLDCENYRVAHGSGALYPYYGRSTGAVGKSTEWERCIEHWIEEGEAPADATSWKCPRSLEAELKK